MQKWLLFVLSVAVEALRIAAIGERPYEQVALYASVGLLELRRGQLSQAIERLEPALSLCQAAGIHHLFPTTALQHALAQADAMEIRPLLAHCHFSLGNLYRLHGHAAQAGSELSTALALYQSMGMDFWAEHLQAVLGSS